MPTPLTCPLCAKPLPPDSPQGLCPACLLRAGVPTDLPGAATPRRAFMAPTPAELAPHFPQLEILELIGQGGMGAVYRARQPSLERFVALKILRPQTGGDPGFAERFTREAKALARLSHPNIVAVHDFGRAGAFHFLLMEFVDGVNLRHLLTTGKIDAREALAIVPPICDALQYAHDRGIVHRDIKPENILLGKNGAVKIADFGLAKLIGGEAADFSLTGDRDVMGTPHYMAPEQVEHPLEVDHRADIYSLGVVFYQMLTGELPLGRFAPPSRRVTIDVRLDEVVLRALEKAPEQRYQQASALKTELETIATTKSESSTGILPVGSKKNAPRTSPTGIDYRSQRTLWGRPLLHIATGRDPATGKRRVARGVIAIGTFARGVVAIGVFASGWIAIGVFAAGALALGGFAVGLLALAGSAVGLVFAMGKVAVGGLAMGGAAIGYLAYGDTARGVHAVDGKGIDQFAAEFFLRWGTTLLRTGVAAGFIAVSALQIAAAALTRHALRRATERRWRRAILCSAIMALLFVGDLGLVAGWWSARSFARSAIGAVDSLSPLVRLSPDIHRYVVVQGWLVDLPADETLTSVNFGTKPAPGSHRAATHQILPPFSCGSGGNFTIRPKILTKEEADWFFVKLSFNPRNKAAMEAIRFRVKSTIDADGYRYTIAAIWDANPRIEHRNGVDRAVPGTQELAISGRVASGDPVIFELGSLSEGRKHVAVFLFQPWSAELQRNPFAHPSAASPQSRDDAASPNNAATPVFPPTEFDAMESNPEILRERLQLAEADLKLVRARFDAGLGMNETVRLAEQKVVRLKAKLRGDRLAFAKGDVEVAQKHFEEIAVRRAAGIATDQDRLAAQTELRIAEIRLRDEESRGALPATALARNSTAPQPARIGADSPPLAYPSFDAMESDPEILRLRIEQAIAEVQVVQRGIRTGNISPSELAAVDRKRLRLEARLHGDRVAFSSYDVADATGKLERATQAVKSGAASSTDLQAAQREYQIAEIRLSREKERQAEAANTAAQARPASP